MVDPKDVGSGGLCLKGREADHAIRTLRLKKGDRFIAVDGEGKSYLCEASEILRQCVKADVMRELPFSDQNSKRCVTLAVALTKSGVIENILRKGTEMGCRHFMFFAGERSVIRKVSEGKVIRCRSIVMDAVKQSKQATIPEIRFAKDFASVLKGAGAHDKALVPSLERPARHIRDCLGDIPRDAKILCCIGPEGDFTKREMDLARAQGCELVSLGNTVLKVETAAVYVLANLL